MRIAGAALAAAIVTISACNRAPDETVANEPNVAAEADSTPTATEARSEGGLPDDRTPLPEPKGPIDPKSAEAAGQVVQSYGALIEQGRWNEAEKLWGTPAAARNFTAELKRESEVHLEIGKPGQTEGAAGSIYVTMPVVFYGKAGAKDFRRPADIILRRVNDVPGSTEEQRRWHIERIDWAARD